MMLCHTLKYMFDGRQIIGRCRPFPSQGRRGDGFPIQLSNSMRMRLRIPAARIAPESCFTFRPLENRGRREDRVRAAPAVSCAKRTKRNAHEHTGSAEASRPSLRSGFTAYFVLSPVNGFLATVAPEKLASQET